MGGAKKAVTEQAPAHDHQVSQINLPTPSPAQTQSGEQMVNELIQVWSNEAEMELKKIPFFVRGKAKRNTEKFAKETGVMQITVETLYEAKAHFSR